MKRFFSSKDAEQDLQIKTLQQQILSLEKNQLNTNIEITKGAIATAALYTLYLNKKVGNLKESSVLFQLIASRYTPISARFLLLSILGVHITQNTWVDMITESKNEEKEESKKI